MKNQENAIEVCHISKCFKVYYDKGITIKDRFLSRGRSRYEERKVLKDISFEVKKGEAIGLIGKNGCGKSTTLKLLTQIIYPNSGTIEMKGRVSSLLELGAGFHPDMSGRENIYMNAAVFGLTHREIDKRLKEIIQFSELEAFIDNPVRTYSSGMYMRLAFSVAINVDADILLIDEILAVGDISFQKKCFEKLNDIKRAGTTIVIVSHSMDQIEKICDKSIWIEDGLVKEEGRPKDIHEHYLYAMEQERLQRFQKDYYKDANIPQIPNEQQENESIPHTEVFFEASDSSPMITDFPMADEISNLKLNFLNADNQAIVHTGYQDARFTDMYITDITGKEKIIFETGEDIVVYLKYQTKKSDLRGTLCLLIYRDDGIYCYGTNTYIEHKEIVSLSQYQCLKVILHNVPLLPGKYYFTIAMHDEQAVDYDHVEKAADIQFYANKGIQGLCKIDTDWMLG